MKVNFKEAMAACVNGSRIKDSSGFVLWFDENGNLRMQSPGFVGETTANLSVNQVGGEWEIAE